MRSFKPPDLPLKAARLGLRYLSITSFFVSVSVHSIGIPRILFQTGVSDQEHPEYVNRLLDVFCPNGSQRDIQNGGVLDGATPLNTGIETENVCRYRYHSNTDCLNLFENHPISFFPHEDVLDVYHKLPHRLNLPNPDTARTPHRGDLCGFWHLYVFGGLLFQTDCLFVDGNKEVIQDAFGNKNTTLILVRHGSPLDGLDSTVGAIPGHPVARRVLETIRETKFPRHYLFWCCETLFEAARGFVGKEIGNNGNVDNALDNTGIYEKLGIVFLQLLQDHFDIPEFPQHHIAVDTKGRIWIRHIPMARSGEDIVNKILGSFARVLKFPGVSDPFNSLTSSSISPVSSFTSAAFSNPVHAPTIDDVLGLKQTPQGFILPAAFQVTNIGRFDEVVMPKTRFELWRGRISWWHSLKIVERDGLQKYWDELMGLFGVSFALALVGRRDFWTLWPPETSSGMGMAMGRKNNRTRLGDAVSSSISDHDPATDFSFCQNYQKLDEASDIPKHRTICHRGKYKRREGPLASGLQRPDGLDFGVTTVSDERIGEGLKYVRWEKKCWREGNVEKQRANDTHFYGGHFFNAERVCRFLPASGNDEEEGSVFLFSDDYGKV